MLKRKDQIAIVSPSSTIAGSFPWVFNQGLARIEEVFGLSPIVMPNCLNVTATQKDRCQDLHDAYRNPQIKAVVASTGGIDQIQLIPYLDPKIFAQNQKPFFGYSDNTHLCNFLNSLGVTSFYGGSVLSQFGMQGAMCSETIRSLEWAFFRPEEWFSIIAPKYCIDEDYPWDDPQGEIWDGASSVTSLRLPLPVHTSCNQAA